MADYKELGIQIPDQIPLDELDDANNVGMGIFREQMRNAELLATFSHQNDWNTYKRALALARDLEDQVTYHASLRKPEAMAEDQLRIQYKELLTKLPKIDRHYGSHDFSTTGNRKDFASAGINDELLKVLFQDDLKWGSRHEYQHGRFDLKIGKNSLGIKNHNSKVNLEVKLTEINSNFDNLRIGEFVVRASTYPFEVDESDRNVQHLKIATEALSGLGKKRMGINEEISLFDIGRKYNIASSLITVASQMTDSYLSSLAPYTKQKTA